MCFISSNLTLQKEKQSRDLSLFYILSSIHPHTPEDILYLSVALEAIICSMYLLNWNQKIIMPQLRSLLLHIQHMCIFVRMHLCVYVLICLRPVSVSVCVRVCGST